MKRILSVFVTAALLGCGGGGGNGNVQETVDDPMGIEAAIEATGASDNTGGLLVVQGGIPMFVDTESLDARSQAVQEGGAGSGGFARAGARGGLDHYRVRGESEREGVTTLLEGYGAWGVHNHFRVFGIGVGGETAFLGMSDGRFSESNPGGDMGTATWRGAMIGEFVRQEPERMPTEIGGGSSSIG